MPDVDRDRRLADDDLPQACLDALEEHSVLLLRELNIDDERQAAFCRKLGKLVRFPHYPTPEVMEISFDPDNRNAEYSASNDYWHTDGALDAIPAKTWSRGRTGSTRWRHGYRRTRRRGGPFEC